jgi:hypothetical protein
VAKRGFASVAIELPGGGDRDRVPALEQARADLRAALAAGEPVDEIIDALVRPTPHVGVDLWRQVSVGLELSRGGT